MAKIPIDMYNVMRYNNGAADDSGANGQDCGDSPVIRSFHDQGTEDIFNGVDSKHARRTCPNQIWKVAQRKLDQVSAAATLGDLRIPPQNRLEALTGDRKGQHSIRVNDQYRVCFRWTDDGAAEDVEIVDYH